MSNSLLLKHHMSRVRIVAASMVALMCLALGVGAAEPKSVLRADCAELIGRAAKYLPAGWRIAEVSFGPQQIANRWGGQPPGLQVRIDGPKLWRPYIYIGPALSAAEMRAFYRWRPESVTLWAVPRSYKLDKDIFVADWFRPDDEKTHRLRSTRRLHLYGYAGRSLSWKTWRTDLRRNSRK